MSATINVNRISRYYDNMERRSFLMIFPVSAALLGAAENIARGKLTKSPTGDPALQESNGQFILLSGDRDTVGVLKDERLADADFEVVGQTSRPEDSRSIRFTSGRCSLTKMESGSW